jgi:hypothetical protein
MSINFNYFRLCSNGFCSNGVAIECLTRHLFYTLCLSKPPIIAVISLISHKITRAPQRLGYIRPNVFFEEKGKNLNQETCLKNVFFFLIIILMILYDLQDRGIFNLKCTIYKSFIVITRQC